MKKLQSVCTLSREDYNTSQITQNQLTFNDGDAMAHLSLELLGSLHIAQDGQPVNGFASDKVRALLVYLAMEPDRPHRRERLAGLLWPDFPERSARTNLRGALTNLRQVIRDRQADPAYLEITRQTLQFNTRCDHWLDVQTLQKGVAIQPDGGEVVLQTEISALEDAVAVYHGPFLTGFTLADSPLFEEWLLLQRETIERQFIRVLRRLIDALAQHKMIDDALHYARHWLDLDPWHEEAHRALMRLLALNGRRSEALAQYQHCEAILNRELGVKPTAETTALFEKIHTDNLVQTSSVRSATESRPKPITRLDVQSPTDWPASLTPFIGRETELAQLTQWLISADRRLISLVGPGGTGKTRLALEVAHTLKGDFPHGVYFVPLASLQRVEAIIPAIAQALHFTFYDAGEPEDQLHDYLRHKSLLLVLDNFEHLLEGVSLIVSLLQTASNTRLLVTSRSRLNVHGEQIFPLNGLSTSVENKQQESLGTNSDAVTLFLDSARRVDPGFDLTDDNSADVIDLCRLLQGLPLAVLLAASWIDTLTPGQIGQEIQHNFDFLQANITGLPERQHTLRSVFAHSWRLLNAREQVVLARLAIFRGSFDYPAAQTVAQATLPELRSLRQKSLLRRNSAGRYALHELLRQFAAEKLAQSPATEHETQAAHSAFFCHFLQEQETDLKGRQQIDALARIETEIDNIHLAWTWAANQCRADYLDQGSHSLGYFYAWRSRFAEGERAFGLAEAALCDAVSRQDKLVLAKVQIWRSRLNRLLGQPQVAAQCLQRSQTVLEALNLDGATARLAQAHLLLELAYQAQRSNIDEAKEKCRRSLTIYQALDHQWETAEGLGLLGDLHHQLGAYVEGTRLCEESLHLKEALGDRLGVADSLQEIGFMAVLQGQIERGEDLLNQSLIIQRELNNQAAIAKIYHSLNISRTWAGDYLNAIAFAQLAHRLHVELGNRRNIAGSETLIASAYLQFGEYEQARHHLQIAHQICTELDDVSFKSFLLWEIGCAVLIERNFTEAQALFQESIALHQQFGDWGRQHEVVISLGFALWGDGQITKAHQCLIDGLRVALDSNFLRAKLEALLLAALLLIEEDNPILALELYTLASRYPIVANSRWYDDVAGQHIIKVVDGLPSAVVDAAKKRGQQRDLEEATQEVLTMMSN